MCVCVYVCVCVRGGGGGGGGVNYAAAHICSFVLYRMAGHTFVLKVVSECTPKVTSIWYKKSDETKLKGPGRVLE